MTDIYLIWSNEHEGWWKPGERGYSTGLNGAGHYSREAAIRICRQALPTAAHIRRISEIPVRLDDLAAFLEGQVIPDAVLGGTK